jgi:ABC-type Zn uptake system ZnuABC Zn-binding protein ZnuA
MLRLLLPILLCCAATAAEPLRVCCTTTDLGSLARHVGGERVAVTVFARGGDDVHFIEAKPSFAKQLHGADLLVEVGMELEVAWVPALVDQAANPRVRAGAPGRLSAALANTAPLGRPTGTVDRSLGDVHAAGNPHYLADPVIGWRVATLLRDRFTALRPEDKDAFQAGWAAFTADLADRLVGHALAARLGAETVLALVDSGALDSRVAQDDVKDTPLAGWLGAVRPIRGAPVIADHDLWPYAAQRFGFQVIGFLEPRPGLPPTSKHLAEVVELAKAHQVRVIINAPYFDPKPGALVASRSGAAVVVLPHQAGSLDGTEDYLAFIDRLVSGLTAGFVHP